MSVRDRLFASAPHLNRNIFSQLPVDSDVPANVAGDLDSGWPWCLADLVPYSSMYLAAVQRFSIFVFSQLAKKFIWRVGLTLRAPTFQFFLSYIFFSNLLLPPLRAAALRRRVLKIVDTPLAGWPANLLVIM